MCRQTMIASTLLGMLLASAAHAQFPTPTTRTLDITLIGDCSKLPPNILVVYDGLDRDPESAVQDPLNKCHYTVERRSGDALTIGRTLFSLRLGNARTDCRVASEIAGRTPPYLPIGVLKFPFRRDSAHDLTIASHPATGNFVVRYGRRYRRDSTLDDSRGCDERAAFEVSETLEDVTFERETIDVALAGTPLRIFIDEDMQREIRRKAKQSGEASFAPAALGQAYNRQNSTGALPDATLRSSGNAAATLAERLRDKKLAKVTLRQE
jgi:hypothetical protein